jgi:capsular exopolysaccharide synthesis family protein
MTTLPQTTNMRLPRPAQGQIQLAGPGGGGTLGPAGAAQQQGQGSNDVWRIIRAHIWLIIIVAGIVAPIAGLAADWFLARHYPKFTSAGLIQVQPAVNAKDLLSASGAVSDPANTALEIRSQAQALQTDALLTRVLQNPNSEVRRTHWFSQFNGDIREAKANFERNLSVTPLQDTKFVKVEFTYAKPEDCKTVVFELVSTFLEEQKKRNTDELLDRTSMLNNVKIKSEMRMKDLTSEMKEKQVKLNLDGGGIGRIGIKEMELSKLVGEQVEAQLMAGKAKASYDATDAAVRQGQDPPLTDVYVQKLAPFLANDEYQLQQAELERDLVAETRGTENPNYKALASRCERMRANYQQKYDQARAKAKVIILEEMAQQYQAEAGKLESLSKRVDNLKQDLGELSNAMITYFTLQEEQKALREQIKTVKEQIDNVMALQSSASASRVQWHTMPETPMNRSFPKRWLVVTVAIALGLGLSLGIAFLRDAMDQSVRTPRDIARVGNINLLGLIPDESDDPQSAGARLPVVIFDAPHSAMAESFRHVRTKLQHTASLDTTRSIMVTSSSPGDGKTTIACNLAAGLALNGRRILLVDANFRRPEVNKVFGLSNDQGFSDVLNAVAAFDEVIQETQVPNLAVMAAGPKPMNPTELFESQLLIDFIERALEEFDHVIFDSGPLMVVAEAQAMAPRVDGVISVVRYKTNNRGLLQRMRDELRRTKAEHLGVVLNAVRAQGGGYYRRNIQTYYDYANQPA